MGKISVKINGNDIELEKSLTVADMLKEREVTGSMFVVEKNLQIVPKENYATEQIQTNDNFEIVGFFGGG